MQRSEWNVIPRERIPQRGHCLILPDGFFFFFFASLLLTTCEPSNRSSHSDPRARLRFSLRTRSQFILPPMLTSLCGEECSKFGAENPVCITCVETAKVAFYAF